MQDIEARSDVFVILQSHSNPSLMACVSSGTTRCTFRSAKQRHRRQRALTFPVAPGS